MRRFAVLFLVSAVATASFAQPAPMNPLAGAMGSSETGLTPDGKIMLGLEGRGNYRKPKVGKKTKLPATSTGVKEAPSDFTQAMRGGQGVTTTTNTTAPKATKPTTAPATTPVAPTPEPATGERALRSDKAMLSPKQAEPALAAPVSKVIPNTLPVLPNAATAAKP